FLTATVELRGRADVEADLARRDAEALYALLADRGILADPAIGPRPAWQGPAVRHAQVVNVTAPALGALFLAVAPGPRVTEEPGHDSGVVEVTAPVEGLVIIRASDRMARPGDTIATIIADRTVPGSAAGRTLSN